MTVSVFVTAEARVRVTVAPLMATPPLATLRRALPTVTLKSPGAGTEPVSRFSSKVTVSAVPSTVAPEKVGAIASSARTLRATAKSPNSAPVPDPRTVMLTFWVGSRFEKTCVLKLAGRTTELVLVPVSVPTVH